MGDAAAAPNPAPAAAPAPASAPRRASSFEPQVAEAFGTVVRAERKRLAIAQDQFALLANVDRSYFGKLERGERQPSLALMLRVAGGLGCSGAELVARVEQWLEAQNGQGVPPGLSTGAQKALYAALGDATLSLRLDQLIREVRVDGWREQAAQVKRMRQAIRHVLNASLPVASALLAQEGGRHRATAFDLEGETDRLLELVQQQADY